MKILNYICLIVIFFFQNSSATRITLQASPGNVYQSLTKTLNLRCAVESNTATIQRQSYTDFSTYSWWTDTTERYTTSDQWWQEDSTEVSWPTETTTGATMTATAATTTSKTETTNSATQPPVEISHITSIIVSRIDAFSGIQHKVASLSSFDPPSADIDFDKIQVEGQANSSPIRGELGYLEVIWEYPTSSQAGVYTCEVYALDTSLHPVSLSQTVQITSLEPTISDLAFIIAQKDKTITELQESVNNLIIQVAALNLHQTQEYNLFLNNITEIIQERIGNLKAQNIQTGYVTCTNDHVEFLKPYSRIPTVFVAATSIEYQGSTGSMTVTVQNLGEYGFTPVCNVYGLARSTFVWIAIDS